VLAHVADSPGVPSPAAPRRIPLGSVDQLGPRQHSHTHFYFMVTVLKVVILAVMPYFWRGDHHFLIPSPPFPTVTGYRLAVTVYRRYRGRAGQVEVRPSYGVSVPNVQRAVSTLAAMYRPSPAGALPPASQACRERGIARPPSPGTRRRVELVRPLRAAGIPGPHRVPRRIACSPSRLRPSATDVRGDYGSAFCQQVFHTLPIALGSAWITTSRCRRRTRRRPPYGDVLTLPPTGGVIHADPQRSGQVLNNLLTTRSSTRRRTVRWRWPAPRGGSTRHRNRNAMGARVPPPTAVTVRGPSNRVPGLRAVGDSSAHGKAGEPRASAVGPGPVHRRELLNGTAVTSGTEQP